MSRSSQTLELLDFRCQGELFTVKFASELSICRGTSDFLTVTALPRFFFILSFIKLLSI